MAEFLKSESDTIQLISPIISFINSQKRKLMLVIDDYIFKLNRESKTTRYWICAFNPLVTGPVYIRAELLAILTSL
jgi:hypothetical protein